MKLALTLSVMGISLLIPDPAAAGFAPEAHGSALLSLAGMSGISLLTLWSEQWGGMREARADLSQPLMKPEEFSCHGMPAGEHAG
jgi:hypothetical protein